MNDPSALDYFVSVVLIIDWFILVFLFVYCLHYLFQLVTAWFELRTVFREEKQADPWWLLTGQVAFPISIIVGAYNEEKTIVDSLHGMLSLQYPDYEVVVANDGSTDSTLSLLDTAFDLQLTRRLYERIAPCNKIRGVYQSRRFPNLIVVDKENGGRADALNAAMNVARNPLVCATDADTILAPDALLHLVRPFILHPEDMVAGGRKIRVVNGCEVQSSRIKNVDLPHNLLALFQYVEYIRSFQMCRLSWNYLGALINISGAFGLFKRDVALEVGGFGKTVGEDMDMTMKMHRYGYERGRRTRLAYVPDAVWWTEGPTTLNILRNQRTRWHRGLLDVLRLHKDMIMNPRYGVVGMVCLAYLLIVDGLGPILELLGLIIGSLSWGLGILNDAFFVAYMSLMFTFGVFISTWPLFLEEVTSKDKTRPLDLAVLVAASELENFGYRQLNGLWRIVGAW
jgi:cellulose synthase/poly-beta-1,6-N-acetylglucosamine synthase-like glycosyltransferase